MAYGVQYGVDPYADQLAGALGAVDLWAYAFGHGPMGDEPFGDGVPYPPYEETYPTDPMEKIDRDAPQYKGAIAFPMHFDDNGDLLLTKDESTYNDDLKMCVFVRQQGIPLFPFGAGVEELIFDPMDFPTQVFLSDKIGLAVTQGNTKLRVIEDEIAYTEYEDNKLTVAVPYINAQTGRGGSALLSIPKLRTDS